MCGINRSGMCWGWKGQKDKGSYKTKHKPTKEPQTGQSGSLGLVFSGGSYDKPRNAYCVVK